MAYGIEVFNSSGVKLLELSNRVARFVANGQVTTTGSYPVYTATVSITGLQNNDSWQVMIFSGSLAGGKVSKSAGSFTITSASPLTFDYWVVRA